MVCPSTLCWGKVSSITDLCLPHWHSPNGETWEGETRVVSGYPPEPAPAKHPRAPLRSVLRTSARAYAEGKVFW